MDPGGMILGSSIWKGQDMNNPGWAAAAGFVIGMLFGGIGALMFLMFLSALYY